MVMRSKRIAEKFSGAGPQTARRICAHKASRMRRPSTVLQASSTSQLQIHLTITIICGFRRLPGAARIREVTPTLKGLRPMNRRNFLKTKYALLASTLMLWSLGCGGYGGGNGGGSAPSAPTGLMATPGNAQVSLTWSASSGATGYYVKRSTTGGGPYTQAGNPAAAGFTD